MAAKNVVEIVDNVVKSTVKYKVEHNSFVALLFDLLGGNAKKVVLVDNDSGRKWTASELLHSIVTLGIKLTEFGISKGDVVAFFCPNSDLHVIAKLTIWATGAVYTGLTHQSPLRELNNVITKTGAKYLVGSKCTIDVCNTFITSSKTIKKFFIIDDFNDTNAMSIYAMIKSEVKHEEREIFFEIMSKVKPTDLCKISFSSGTTGEPKLVMEEHRRYISYTRFREPEFDIVTNMDTCALFYILPHVGGSMFLCFDLVKEACVVVFSHFDCNRFITDVQKHGITFASVVPSHINLLNQIVSHPIKSFCLEKIITGGEFAQESVCKEFIEKFRPKYFGVDYGSSETGLVTLCPISDGAKKFDAVKSVGVPSPGNEIKIIDLITGNKLGSNQSGEICVKGPEVIKGYLSNEKANRASFDEESFFKSGDIGYFDEEGYLYIIDRIKEVIKFNTQQVSPTELQNILVQHEAVKEAAVVGVPDDMFGQLPKAFVVLNEKFKGTVNENNLLEFVNEKVMDFKKLRGGLMFMSELPKSIIGKVDTKALKTM